jgi:hypothetical protein
MEQASQTEQTSQPQLEPPAPAAAPPLVSVEIWVEEIRGIVYYFDDKGNIYHTEDVYDGRNNPRIIGKWVSVDASKNKILYLN